MSHLVLYVDLEGPRLKAAVQATRAWLRELGAESAEALTVYEPGETQYPVRLEVVSALGLPPGATEARLSERLRNTLDIYAPTSAEMTQRRERIARHIGYSAYMSALRVGHDSAGVRTDLPGHVRALLHKPHRFDPADPELWSEPDYSSRDAEYVKRVDAIAQKLRVEDLALLWKHLARPQAPGRLIYLLNDDGLMATADPEQIRFADGYDSICPWISRFGGPVWVRDVLSVRRDQEHRRRQERSAGLLLRDSKYARKMDGAPDLRDGTWRAEPIVGAMTGWIVHTEDAKPWVEPWATNSERSAGYGDFINDYLGTIGDSGVSWAAAHDLLVTGRCSTNVGPPLRMFMADLLSDLIIAWDGLWAVPAHSSWPDTTANAVAEEQQVVRGAFSLTDKPFFDVQRILQAIYKDSPDAFEAYAEVRRQCVEGPDEAVKVSYVAVANDEGLRAVWLLADALGVLEAT